MGPASTSTLSFQSLQKTQEKLLNLSLVALTKKKVVEGIEIVARFIDKVAKLTTVLSLGCS